MLQGTEGRLDQLYYGNTSGILRYDLCFNLDCFETDSGDERSDKHFSVCTIAY